ncbi:LPXTG cell wall anchor domain-containing protein [Staphylococcus warneri]|uniref:LPXTG cell wall anchor domain-containing protein n=1 Tax=Staphylococcus warneri TaxID=1292 RepID=UPI0021B18F57
MEHHSALHVDSHHHTDKLPETGQQNESSNTTLLGGILGGILAGIASLLLLGRRRKNQK